MEPFETFEHAGCTIELYPDEDPMSPAEWDTLGTMYQHGRAEYRGLEEADRNATDMMERRGVAGMLRYLSLTGTTAVPFDIYEHGGVTVRESSERDDSCSGYIATNAASIAAMGVPADKVEDALRSELRTWAYYFEGSVFGYVVTRNGTTVDSCWGFYPDSYPDRTGDVLEYVREEARAVAEWEEEQYRAALAQGIPTKEGD